jgi:hypothetical protein
MSSRVVEVVNAMMATMQEIPGLRNKVLFTYDDEDLMNQIKVVRNLPVLGIIYEGIHSLAEPSPSGRVGISSELILSLALIDQGEGVQRSPQNKIDSLELLDAMREKIINTRSPTGHFWRFMVETNAVLKANVVVWVQRYSTPIQLRGQNMG